jgi:hypothetical protein
MKKEKKKQMDKVNNLLQSIIFFDEEKLEKNFVIQNK